MLGNAMEGSECRIHEHDLLPFSPQVGKDACNPSGETSASPRPNLIGALYDDTGHNDENEDGYNDE